MKTGCRRRRGWRVRSGLVVPTSSARSSASIRHCVADEEPTEQGLLLAEQATGAVGANPGNGKGANPLQPAPASSTGSAAAGVAQRASTMMWRRARWISRGRGSARRARHHNLPRAAVPMAGGSGAEAGHYREEFHRRKDDVARVRRARCRCSPLVPAVVLLPWPPPCSPAPQGELCLTSASFPQYRYTEALCPLNSWPATVARVSRFCLLEYLCCFSASCSLCCEPHCNSLS